MKLPHYYQLSKYHEKVKMLLWSDHMITVCTSKLYDLRLQTKIISKVKFRNHYLSIQIHDRFQLVLHRIHSADLSFKKY